MVSFSSSSACDSAPTYQILSKLGGQRQSYDVMYIFQDDGNITAIPSQIHFRFPVLWRLTFRKVKTICVQNFDQITQFTAEMILLLPVAKNKRPSYWNSTPGFDIDLVTVIGMWFCTSLEKFIRIRWSATELWGHINFSKWRPYRRNSTSVFTRTWLRYVRVFAVAIPSVCRLSVCLSVVCRL